MRPSGPSMRGSARSAVPNTRTSPIRKRSMRFSASRSSRASCPRSSRPTPSRMRSGSRLGSGPTRCCSSICRVAATRTSRPWRRGFMSRLAEAFARLRTEHRPGLVTYVTAGDPDLARSGEILKAIDRAGADVLEVGVPFSDPLADGPVIQRATERALASGATLRGVLDLLGRVRPELRAPVVVFSYANPLLRLGVDAFARRAAAAGVDGVLALDLPIEEAGEFRDTLARAGLDTILLLSPTTTDDRIRKAAAI